MLCAACADANPSTSAPDVFYEDSSFSRVPNSDPQSHQDGTARYPVVTLYPISAGDQGFSFISQNFAVKSCTEAKAPSLRGFGLLALDTACVAELMF